MADDSEQDQKINDDGNSGHNQKVNITDSGNSSHNQKVNTRDYGNSSQNHDVNITDDGNFSQNQNVNKTIHENSNFSSELVVSEPMESDAANSLIESFKQSEQTHKIPYLITKNFPPNYQPEESFRLIVITKSSQDVFVETNQEDVENRRVQINTIVRTYESNRSLKRDTSTGSVVRDSSTGNVIREVSIGNVVHDSPSSGFKRDSTMNYMVRNSTNKIGIDKSKDNNAGDEDTNKRDHDESTDKKSSDKSTDEKASDPNTDKETRDKSTGKKASDEDKDKKAHDEDTDDLNSFPNQLNKTNEKESIEEKEIEVIYSPVEINETPEETDDDRPESRGRHAKDSRYDGHDGFIYKTSCTCRRQSKGKNESTDINDTYENVSKNVCMCKTTIEGTDINGDDGNANCPFGTVCTCNIIQDRIRINNTDGDCPHENGWICKNNRTNIINRDNNVDGLCENCLTCKTIHESSKRTDRDGNNVANYISLGAFDYQTKNAGLKAKPSKNRWNRRKGRKGKQKGALVNIYANKTGRRLGDAREMAMMLKTIALLVTTVSVAILATALLYLIVRGSGGVARTTHEGVFKVNEGVYIVNARVCRINEVVYLIKVKVCTVDEGVHRMKARVHRINEGVHIMNEGVQIINEGFCIINSTVGRKNEGLKVMNEGFHIFNEGIQTINEGIQTINEGVHTINEGVQIMNSRDRKLNQGVSHKFEQSRTYQPSSLNYLEEVYNRAVLRDALTELTMRKMLLDLKIKSLLRVYLRQNREQLYG